MRCIEAKQAADLAAAAHEETLQHLRDKAEITAALKLREFKTSLAAVATTQATRATEVRAIFDEMAARLSESSPPPYAGNSVSSATEEDKPYEGGGAATPTQSPAPTAGGKASVDPQQPSEAAAVVVVVVDSTSQSGGDPKTTSNEEELESDVVDTEPQTKASNGATQDKTETAADDNACPESSAHKSPESNAESIPVVEKTAM